MKQDLHIENQEQWEELKNKTMTEREVVIFKFSPICSISSKVQSIFNDWFNNIPGELPVTCARVNVIAEREISWNIAKDLEIVHQSPQVIWLSKSGEVKWHASHYNITESKLDELVKDINKN